VLPGRSLLRFCRAVLICSRFLLILIRNSDPAFLVIPFPSHELSALDFFDHPKGCIYTPQKLKILKCKVVIPEAEYKIGAIEVYSEDEVGLTPMVNR
jgi:hypothetical protein